MAMSGSSASRIAALACGWALALFPATGWTGEARVIASSAASRVVIDARDANIGEVLAALAAHFEFAIDGQAVSEQAVRFFGRLEGSLDQLLERLLRNEGHI